MTLAYKVVDGEHYYLSHLDTFNNMQFTKVLDEARLFTQEEEKEIENNELLQGLGIKIEHNVTYKLKDSEGLYLINYSIKNAEAPLYLNLHAPNFGVNKDALTDVAFSTNAAIKINDARAIDVLDSMDFLERAKISSSLKVRRQ